ncbi:membrane protein [Cypionkella aquatica]|uniref:Membrane protein n=1 Tax=Cypionkella aquatica TaxID=1756042 RepID=A0AA37X2C9_9RHOB|nr:trimeric intracellular cation channel family protein [Cypionkella aquatica]GLS87994.1 membrane protein [Cypionkella aquatica]
MSEIVPLLQTPILQVLDLAAAAVFAVTGALVASRKQMDILGFLWLGVVTGVGGGTLRDLLLGVPVFWVSDPRPVAVCLVMAALIHFGAHLVGSRYRMVLYLDAFGMALVTIAGTSKGLDAGAGPLVAVVMGVITAAVGGIIRDLLGQEPSILLRREIYVSASAAGAVLFIGAMAVDLPTEVAMGVGLAAACLIRILAIRFDWALPVFRPRPERPPH